MTNYDQLIRPSTTKYNKSDQDHSLNHDQIRAQPSTDSTKINRPGHNIRMYWTNSRQPTHYLMREKYQFCNHFWSLESFHTLRIFVWKFNFHQAIQRVCGKNTWWKLNFHTKILRVWNDSKLQEWLQNWSFSLINMWSEYWLSLRKVILTTIYLCSKVDLQLASFKEEQRPDHSEAAVLAHVLFRKHNWNFFHRTC